MRELILLRHAHAEPPAAGQEDFDRALSREGQAEADAAWTKRVTDVRNWSSFKAREKYRADDRRVAHDDRGQAEVVDRVLQVDQRRSVVPQRRHEVALAVQHLVHGGDRDGDDSVPAGGDSDQLFRPAASRVAARGH